jgi:hypothetical protein
LKAINRGKIDQSETPAEPKQRSVSPPKKKSIEKPKPVRGKKVPEKAISEE